MITPSFGLTATERVLPKLALDFTTASLDSRVTFTRTTGASNPATYVDSNGYVTSATNNQPRFDYDPVTLACKGLLIEETRTNLVTYSQDFSQWNGVNNTSVNTDVASAPNNLTEADEIVGAVTAGGNQIVRTVTGLTTSTNYVLSVFFKPVVGGYACIRLGLTGFDGTTRQATINVDTGALVSSSNATLLNVETFANGFKRFSVSVTSGSGVGTTSFRIYGADATGGPFGSLPGQKVIIWGAQLEAGAFATSYIPTTSASLTRTADVAVMTGTNFSDWFNASEGTFEISATSNSTAAVNKSLLAVGTGTSFASGSYIFVNSANTNIGFRVYNSAVSTVGASDYTAVTPSPGTQIIAAMGYESDNFGFAVSAQTVATDLSGTLSGTATNLSLGASLSGTTPANGHIQSLRYWTQRLINAEIQAISKG